MRWCLLAILCGAATGVTAGDEEKLRVPEKSMKDIVLLAVKNIKSGFDAKDLSTEIVRSNALIIAAAAQNGMDRGGADKKTLATCRDLAIGVAEAMADGKTADAKTRFEPLAKFPEVAAKPDVKTDVRPLKAKFELHDVMQIFKPKTAGGYGIDKELRDLAVTRKPLTEAQVSDKLAQTAWLTALLAQLIAEHDERGKANAKDWKALTDDMRQASLDLAAACEGKKTKDAKTALEKLYNSCSSCHVKFKK